MLNRSDPVVVRLENCGPWARDGRGRPRGQAQSIDGRYQAEHLRGDEEIDRSTPRLQVDVRDAADVWRCINPTSGFPTSEFLGLTGEIVHRLLSERFRSFLNRDGVRIRGRDLEPLIEESIAVAQTRLVKRGPPSPTVRGEVYAQSAAQHRETPSWQRSAI